LKTEFIDYLADILDSIHKIDNFTHGMDFIEFKKDEKTIYAVVRALEVIGEASKRIPPNIRKKHPEVPWKLMDGMRDKLIHEYFGVDLSIIWKTIKDDLPALKTAFEKLVSEHQ